jgi:Na+-driven multidrug efflux pump
MIVETPKRPVRNYTEGNVLVNIIRMGFPSAIGFAAGNIYHIADMFWVSRIGSTAVAAVRDRI